jgi:5-methylcytosine-specific restriction endonuclease McrA
VPLKPESQRLLTTDLSELKLILNKGTLNKIARLKEHLSHKSPNITTAELVAHLVNEKFESLDKASAPLHAPKHVKQRDGILKTATNAKMSTETGAKTEVKSKNVSNKINRYLPTKKRREVWLKNNCQCSYVNSETKRRCTSRFKLEVDHIKPFAMGGSHEPENLRLLCKAHNLHHAIKSYGAKKMTEFMPHLTTTES